MKIPLPSSLTPTRKGRWLMLREGNSLIVHPPGNRRGTNLNAAATMVWQLCDGTRSLQQMTDELEQAGIKTIDDKSADDLATLLSDTIKQLFQFGLIALKPASVRPVMRLGFLGFADNFDPHENYFLKLFSEWVDILIVENDEQPDILVISSKGISGHDNFSVPLLVLLDETGDCETSGFDLVFTTVADQQREGSAAINLPRGYLASHEEQIQPHEKQRISELFSIGTEINNEDPASENTARKKLTIGMATYDDYDGVYFTVQAIRLFHPEVTDETEILVIDNNPKGSCASHLQDLGEKVKGYRYVANDEIRGTAVRDFVFHEAQTDYVMCIDSHVFIEPGAIRKLIDYFEANPDSTDLLQGPLVDDNLQNISTHFVPVWNKGMFGTWGMDERGLDPDAEPFDIPMQGLGLAACKKSAWQGYNQHFRGFGGEEGYIHQKFRNAGARTLCLPFLRWLHRFVRPQGTPYENIWEDRIRNYLIGFEEVGLDTDDVIEHFEGHLNKKVVDRVLEQIGNENNNPFEFFDAIYCINMKNQKERWSRMQRRLRRLGILHRVRRFEAIETPESHHIGCTLSHRKIIEEARDRGYKNVLVLEDDALFHGKTLDYLRQGISELKNQQWNVFYLGGMKWGSDFHKLPQCKHLEQPQGMTCTHALAYNSSFYEKILNDLPSDIGGVRKWTESNAAIDQYLTRQDGLVVISPVVASQATILNAEKEKLRNGYY